VVTIDRLSDAIAVARQIMFLCPQVMIFEFSFSKIWNLQFFFLSLHRHSEGCGESQPVDGWRT